MVIPWLANKGSASLAAQNLVLLVFLHSLERCWAGSGASALALPALHLWAPPNPHFPSNGPMTALLRQVLSIGNQTLPKSTCQQGVAVVVCRVTDVLAGHTDPS